MMLATCHRFIFNNFFNVEGKERKMNCARTLAKENRSYVYLYCQHFNSKIAASMLSCVVGNMTALYDAAYYDNMIVTV